MIVRRFVLAYSAPIDRFSNYAGGPEPLDHLSIPLLSVREFLLHEIQPRDGHFQTRVKPLLRQIALDSIPLLAGGIHDEDCRRPESVESFEPGGMFFDLSFERDEGLMNKVCDLLIRV